MGLRKKHKHNIILKLIILTIMLSIALPFSISLAAISNQTQSEKNYSITEEKIELLVRSNSILGVNRANSKYAPLYCMYHGRALTYFNRYEESTEETDKEFNDDDDILVQSGIFDGTSTINELSEILDTESGIIESNQTLVGDASLSGNDKDDLKRWGMDKPATKTYLKQSYADQSINDSVVYYNAVAWSEYIKIKEQFDGPIEPSVGYAIYYMINQLKIDPSTAYSTAFQKVLWASRNWKNESNVLYPNSNSVRTDAEMSNDIRARAYQYGTVYYEILQHEINGKKDTIFTVTPDKGDTSDDSLKIMVDKTTGLYTVGPYTLKCNYGSKEAQQILYNEIIGTGNKGYFDETKFAVFNDITNINYAEGTFPEFLRADGTRFGNKDEDGVSFPDFVTEEEFYIRFKPSEEGAINRLSEKFDDLNPVIHIQYLKDFKADYLAAYESHQLQAHEVYAEFSQYQLSAKNILSELKVMADQNTSPTNEDGTKTPLKYIVEDIDSISWTTPYGYTVADHIDDSKQTVYGKTDITVTLKFATKSGNDPKYVPVTIHGVDIKQELTGGIHCHDWGEDECDEWDYTGFVVYDHQWYFTGGKYDIDDIIVDDVTLQPLLELNTEGIRDSYDIKDLFLLLYEGRLYKAKEELNIKANMSVGAGETQVKVGGKRINMQLGGYVWIDAGDAKTASFNHMRETDSQQAFNSGRTEEYFQNYSYKGFWDTPNKDKNFTGIQVELYDAGPNKNQDSNDYGAFDSTKPIAYTTTDMYGRYRFYGLAKDPGTNQVRTLLNPLHNYFIKFKFNGQLYTQVNSSDYGKYAKWTNGGEGQNSSADEISENAEPEDVEYSRKAINDRFEKIHSLYDTSIGEGSDNNSYEGKEGKNKAFAMYQKIETGWGEFSNPEKGLDTIKNRASSNEDKHYVYGSRNKETGEDYTNVWAYAYGDAWDDFIKQSTNPEDFKNPEYEDCTLTWFSSDTSKYKTDQDIYEWVLDKSGLKEKWGYDKEYVAQFIKDCLMKAKTISPTYTIQGDYDKFVINNVEENSVREAQKYDPELAPTAWKDFKNLYTKESDQSRYINYGMHERKRADLAVQKDVFSATVISNGEMETYDYRSKTQTMEDNTDSEAHNPINNSRWDIYARRADIMYQIHQQNGETAWVHPLEIRRADYLKTWEDSDKKNLQILITYRIAVKNQGDIPVKVNELIDYYDSNELIFDGDPEGSLTPNEYTSYQYDPTRKTKLEGASSYLEIVRKIGDKEEIIRKDIQLSTTANDGREKRIISDPNGNNYYYDSLFITNLNDGELLQPAEITFAYLTFKVKNAEVTRLSESKITGKPILDIDFNTNDNLIGKRNIAEINSYSTPKQEDNINYGIIDNDSCAGSLDSNDLNKEVGNIIVDNHPLKDHQEDDTDEAPNVRVRISETDDTRVYTGYAYEDNRNEVIDKSVIGNGTYTNDEIKIDGVTMQVWMLQREVDEDGIFTGNYNRSAERLKQYTYYADDGTSKPLEEVITDERYSTGTGEASIVFNAPYIGALQVDETKVKELANLNEDTKKGKYAFASLPSGDYFVRFIYGDTYDTVLTSGDIGKEVKDLIGQEGRNEKSYNGQDYKSTVYQGINTEKVIPQTGSYNGIRGYGYALGNLENSYNIQNYSLIPEVSEGHDYSDFDYAEYQDYVDTGDTGNKKELMYYYDIAAGDNYDRGLSDAKDVYYYRWRANNYGRGTAYQGSTQETQRNTLMEILDSWERLQTYQDENTKTRQEDMLKEFIANTQMVAQTGIISTMGEYNTPETDERDPNNNKNNTTNDHKYVIEDLNLGLVERPEAQLKLTKKISNFQVVLANGQVLFDASKTVRNLYMAEHKGHMTFFTNGDNNPQNKKEENKYNYWSDMLNDKENGVTNLRNQTENLYNLNNPQELRRLAAVVTSANSKGAPELLQVYMDDELMEGAKMQVRYDFIVENAGEVDYIDKQFYYTGKSAAYNGDRKVEDYVSRTNAYSVVDYVSNMLRYDQQYQDSRNGNLIVWKANNLKDLTNSVVLDAKGKPIIENDKVQIENTGTGSIGVTYANPDTIPYGRIDGKSDEEQPYYGYKNENKDQYKKVNGKVSIPIEVENSYREDIINRKYKDTLKTYNQILLTDSLRANTVEQALLPVKYFEDQTKAKENGRGVSFTTLVLSTELSTNNTGDNLVYNNLTELVETQNSVGRRMQYSIVGNQPMSDQSLRNDATIQEDSSEDLVTPIEIDADSAQKIVITKPTGEFKNYTPIIIVSISALAIIAIGAVLIRKIILRK